MCCGQGGTLAPAPPPRLQTCPQQIGFFIGAFPNNIQWKMLNIWNTTPPTLCYTIQYISLLPLYSTYSLLRMLRDHVNWKKSAEKRFQLLVWPHPTAPAPHRVTNKYQNGPKNKWQRMSHRFRRYGDWRGGGAGEDFLNSALCFSIDVIPTCSRCHLSVLLGWGNAIKVRANAIKMPDEHKYKKIIFASCKMYRKGIDILGFSFNYFKLSIFWNNVCGYFCVDLVF